MFLENHTQNCDKISKLLTYNYFSTAVTQPLKISLAIRGANSAYISGTLITGIFKKCTFDLMGIYVKLKI